MTARLTDRYGDVGVVALDPANISDPRAQGWDGRCSYCPADARWERVASETAAKAPRAAQRRRITLCDHHADRFAARALRQALRAASRAVGLLPRTPGPGASPGLSKPVSDIRPALLAPSPEAR